jgi:hypothetical protein
MQLVRMPSSALPPRVLEVPSRMPFLVRPHLLTRYAPFPGGRDILRTPLTLEQSYCSQVAPLQYRHEDHRSDTRCCPSFACENGFAPLLVRRLCLGDREPPLCFHEGLAAGPVPWHAGPFRTLEARPGDLVTLVQGLAHPKSGDYGKLSSTRQAQFDAFLDALFAEIQASLLRLSRTAWQSALTLVRLKRRLRPHRR